MRIVLPCGPKNAKIAVVGEAPGETEVVTGIPFTGSSGQLLDRFMRAAGISRSACYLTNISKERPQDNDFKKRFYNGNEPTEELRILREKLLDELAEVKPNVIVAVGAEALKTLTNKTEILFWRGSILQSPVGKVIPVIHPAHILRAPDSSPRVKSDDLDSGIRGIETYSAMYAASLFDWSRIKEDSEFHELRLPNPVLQTQPTFDQVLWAYREKLKPAKYLAFDIENVNLEIDCIGFSPDPEYAICIPLMSMSGVPYWKENEEAAIWKIISDLLEDSKIGKIAQNVNHDLTYLSRHGCSFNNLAMDTMNAHHCCYCETPKSLAFLCSIYTRFPYYKDQAKSDRWRYNALDAVVTRTCFDQINREMEELGVYEFYHNLVNEIVLPYKEIADIGIRIDTKMKNSITRELEDISRDLQNKLKSLVGYEVNLDSPKQLADLLYSKLHLEAQLHRKTKKVTTDNDALEKLLKKYSGTEAEVYLKIIQEFRDCAKALSTYAKAKVDPDNRLRTVYYVSGTTTGRLSSQKTALNTGADLQNIPKGELRAGCGFGIRSYFLPDSDEDVFIEGDLSGADARVVAFVSQDPGLIGIFKSNRDVHVVNAGIFFNVDCGEGTKENCGDVTKEQRQIAKTCGHAANYGIMARTLSYILKIPEYEAQKYLNIYLNKYPMIKNWHDNVQQQLRTNRTLVTPLGRKHIFFGRLSDSMFREAYAFVPQSTVADIIHIGFKTLYKTIKNKGLDKFGVRIAMNNHDAITVNCPKKLVDVVLPIMKSSMEFPVNFPSEPAVIPVEFSVGKNWFDMKKVDLDG